MANFVGPNGNTVKENQLNVFNIIFNISNKALTIAWILLPILYIVFYVISDVPDLIHCLFSKDHQFSKCFNVTFIKYNIIHMFNGLKDFINKIQRF